MKTAKFRVIDRETYELLGYEQIGVYGNWKCIDMKKGTGTTFVEGIIPGAAIRDRCTGYKTKDGRDVYANDVLLCTAPDCRGYYTVVDKEGEFEVVSRGGQSWRLCEESARAMSFVGMAHNFKTGSVEAVDLDLLDLSCRMFNALQKMTSLWNREIVWNNPGAANREEYVKANETIACALQCLALK